jgi:hypothetical protein
MANKDDSGTFNFPGFEVATDLFGIYSQALQAQVAAWNDAWKAIREGNYGTKELIKSWAVAHESHAKAVEELLRYPVSRSVQANIPAWTTIDMMVSKVTGKITRSVKSRPFSDQANLVCTELAPLGSQSISYLMDAFPVDGQRIDLSIHSWTDGGQQYPLDQNYSTAPRGQYLGFVYDSRQPSEPPLVVVTLRLKVMESIPPPKTTLYDAP